MSKLLALDTGLVPVQEQKSIDSHNDMDSYSTFVFIGKLCVCITYLSEVS